MVTDRAARYDALLMKHYVRVTTHTQRTVREDVLSQKYYVIVIIKGDSLSLTHMHTHTCTHTE